MDDGRENRSKIVSYENLMTLYDEAFVKAAYLTMFRRAADPGGLHYYVRRLRQGHSRTSVLNQLAKSAESGNDWKRIPGIAEAITRFRASRRLTGWRLALTDPELSRTPGSRRSRALENNIGGQSRQLEESLARLSMQQDVLKHLVARSGTGNQSDNFSALGVSGSEHSSLLEIRSRRPEDVRPFDLPPSARAVMNSLQF